MDKIKPKSLIYSMIVQEYATIKAIENSELASIDLRLLIGGEYITRDNYGFSKSQLTTLTGKFNNTVQLSVNKLLRLRYLDKVRKEGGSYKRRYGALYALTPLGIEIVGKFKHEYLKLLHSADSFHLPF